MALNLKGKVSWFGGPDDTGVAPDEGLAFIYDVNDAPDLFLSYQPDGTTGLARRLNPDAYYVACRWDYDQPDQTKTALLEEMALIKAPKTGKQIKVYPADWGPHQDTNRIADVSPATLKYLGITTDDEVEVIFPFTQRGGVSQSQSLSAHRHVIGAFHQMPGRYRNTERSARSNARS